MKKLLIYIFAALVSMPASYAANAYAKLLKSGDTALKYDVAMDYFEQGKYGKAITLLEDIMPAYRGSEQSETLLYTLIQCYYNKKDYISAAHYLDTYTISYLQGRYLENCTFLLANCYYKLSPDPKLDQSYTMSAIEKLQLYLAMYPSGEHVEEAKQMMAEMYDKLAKRELNNAQLYYDLGNYRGNNYRAAVITAHNAMNDFPDSQYIEDYAYIIVNSKYKEAINSVQKKLYTRCEDAWDECYYFMREFPESKHNKDVQKKAKHLKKILDKQNIEISEPVIAN